MHCFYWTKVILILHLLSVGFHFYQVTGAAEYTDDTPTPPNTLHAALVLSKRPHARIVAIDDSVAKSSPGFAGLFLASDIPGSNAIGPIVHDEELFATNIVTCVGQV
jgi:xanthine dehydrogenase/oxidase